MLIILKFFFCFQVLSLMWMQFIQHPFLLALWVILISVFSSIFMGYLISSWLFLALMLIFLGGMMVIFLYFTSVVSSEKISYFMEKNKLLLSGMTLCLFMPDIMKSTSLNYYLIGKNFSMDNSSLNMIMLIYLMLTLLVVVKLSENFKGSLESTFY